MNIMEKFTEMQKENFKVIDGPICETIIAAYVAAVGKKLNKGVTDNGEALLTLPEGTYQAGLRTRGENENINIAFQPDKTFLKVLNGEPTETLPYMEGLDKDLVKLFISYAGYGVSDPDAEADKINPDKLFVDLTEQEGEFLINEIGKCVTTMGKMFAKPGKNISIEIPKFGAFEFTYEDENVTVRFVADTHFKQALKDDNISVEDIGVKVANTGIGAGRATGARRIVKLARK